MLKQKLEVVQFWSGLELDDFQKVRRRRKWRKQHKKGGKHVTGRYMAKYSKLRFWDRVTPQRRKARDFQKAIEIKKINDE